uniref:NADH dehydrogenase [ubiquinone] 1 alpha subcomplex subunit 3 n=1 Tax=Piliocolobus tephrosceles TaxID=591936 RepID=A0A8C9I1A0_9PRIM
MVVRLGTFLKNAWAKEPVWVLSFIIGSLAVILPPLSPYTKYSIMINEATLYNYPVPICDDGNMRTCAATSRAPRAPAWSG